MCLKRLKFIILKLLITGRAESYIRYIRIKLHENNAGILDAICILHQG